MACPYAPYFANPDLSYRGEKLGVRLGAGPQPADNARIMNLTGPEVAAYRAARIRPPDKHLTITAGPGGTVAPHVLGPYDPGESVSVTAHPAPGYILVGWTLDGKPHQADNPINVPMDTDHTLVPRFMPQAASGYRLSAVSAPAEGGDITLSPPLDSYPHDRPVLATAIPRRGYAFAGWLLDGRPDGTRPVTALTISGNQTLTAVFIARPKAKPSAPSRPQAMNARPAHVATMSARASG